MRLISKLINRLKYFISMEGLLYYNKQFSKRINNRVSLYRRDKVELFIDVLILLGILDLIAIFIHQVYYVR